MIYEQGKKRVNKEGKTVAYSESAPQSMIQTHKVADDQGGGLEKQTAGATSALWGCSHQEEHSVSGVLVSPLTEVEVKLCLSSGSGFKKNGSDISGICTFGFLGSTMSKDSGVRSHVSGDTM